MDVTVPVVRWICWLLILVSCKAGGLYAQQIAVEYEGNTNLVSAGGPITIDVGEVAGVRLLRIFDPSPLGLPNDGLSSISIVGSIASGTNAELRILIARDAGWPLSADTPLLEPGLAYWGTAGVGGLQVVNAALRERTRLSAYVSGDVQGDIVVGQVQRLQVGFSATDPTPGLLSANVTAISLNRAFNENERSIGWISAGKGISGNILAAGNASIADAAAEWTLASIYFIGVGPSIDPPTLGISGNILAPAGRIGSIHSTGPVGGVAPITIRAGDGITQIRSGFQDGDLADVDFNIDAVANILMLDPVTGNTDLNYAVRGPDLDGVLSQLEVGGNLDGSIRAANLQCGGGTGNVVPAPVNCYRAGIYVRGIVNAPIQIDHTAVYSNIIARTFRNTVTIGQFMKGAIVATGGALPPPDPQGFIDGHIHHISIGRGFVPPSSWQSYLRYDRGLCGIFGNAQQGPFRPATVDEWFTTDGRDLGALDGVVRAEGSIGAVDIASLNLDYLSGCKSMPARVEAPSIGLVTIDELRLGSIWSGVYDGDPFVGIGAILVGCASPQTAVWMRDWGAAQFGNVLGSIHAPDLPAGQLLRIGGHLGDVNDPSFQPGQPFETVFCECMDEFCDICYAGQDGIPGPWNPLFPSCGTGSGLPLGRVWIRGDLSGQIIVNGNHLTAQNPEAYWTGEVQVGVDPLNAECPLITMATDAPVPDLAPQYTRPSVEVGGGAVGLPPFYLFDEDCDPVNSAGPVLLNSEFNNEPNSPVAPRGLTLRLYGPVRTNADPADSDPSLRQPVRVWMLHFGSNPPPPSEVTKYVTVTVKRGSESGQSREIEVIGNGSWSFGDGKYRIEPVLSGSNRLFCDAVNGAPSVKDFDYEFELISDCNRDGQPDSPQDREICRGSCPCPADWDGSGGPDGDDIGAFFNDWQSGAADADCSGGVDGDDIGVFFHYWQLGGC